MGQHPSSKMIRFLFFLIFFLLAVTSFEDVNENECFKVKDYFWKHLASKTPYKYVANNNSSQINYEGCQPKKIWMVIRHGTRYPPAKLINQIRSKLPEFREAIKNNVKNKKATLCLSHASNITDWTSQVDLEDEKKLTHEGEDEMVELAERFQKRFPTLLDVEYSNSSFLFKSTKTDRTVKSQHYFIVGLFGRKIAHHVWLPEPIYKDPILRFYKMCPKWIKEVKKNPKAEIESQTFKMSKSVREIAKNISRRLGMESDLSFDDLNLIYSTCAYESTWNRFNPSPWCSVFSEEEMEIMEFSRDLKYYWMDGYGHDINFQQACPMMEDMYKHLTSEDGPTSVFYFTHSGTLLKLLSHLGLYYDEVKLTHDRSNRHRLWKVGYMDAFGSNLAFVTFQCGDQLKLLTLHQERPVKLPGCPKEGLCLFNKLTKTYKNSFWNCHFEEICEI